MDIYLHNDSTRWGQFTRFYAQTSAYARKLWPGLKIASEATFSGHTGSDSLFVRKHNTYSDYIGVSYYPFKSGTFTVAAPVQVRQDMGRIVRMNPDTTKPICFYQFGYPSGSGNGSSEAMQAQFISNAFAAWDSLASRIYLIDFTWMHDLSPQAVQRFSKFYGVKDSGFLSFLASLGMRTYPGRGQDKLAWKQLICEAGRRGYNSLSCYTQIADVQADNLTMIRSGYIPIRLGTGCTLKILRASHSAEKSAYMISQAGKYARTDRWTRMGFPARACPQAYISMRYAQEAQYQEGNLFA